MLEKGITSVCRSGRNTWLSTLGYKSERTEGK